MGFKGYARCQGIVGDIREISENFVIIEPFKTNNLNKKKVFKAFMIGESKIELIEFGSFNPKMYNYKKGGRVYKLL